MPSDAVRAEFATRLRRLLKEKGWTQLKFVTLVQKEMPAHGRFERGLLSSYVAGHNLPRPIVFHAMCRALNVAPEMLLPPTKETDGYTPWPDRPTPAP